MQQSTRAQRGRARSALYRRVTNYLGTWLISTEVGPTRQKIDWYRHGSEKLKLNRTSFFGPHSHVNLIFFCRQLIHESLIRGLQILLSARKELRIPFNGQDIEQQSEMVLAFDAYDSIGPENIGDLAVLARRLWKDTAVKETFRRRYLTFVHSGS